MTTDVIDQESKIPPRSNISIASGRSTILFKMQRRRVTLVTRRHSFMFIYFNVSFYITFSKIPIKGSVKYLATQISFLPSSFTFHFYLIHQFPSFSVFPFFYQINHNYHISLSQSSYSELTYTNDRPTDIADRRLHQTLNI